MIRFCVRRKADDDCHFRPPRFYKESNGYDVTTALPLIPKPFSRMRRNGEKRKDTMSWHQNVHLLLFHASLGLT